MKRGGPELLFRIGVAHQASFGKSLEENIRQSDGQIPHVIASCCEAIEENIETEGIYKVNVPARKPEDYGNRRGDDAGRLDAHDVHEVASLLKAFLNRLPVPLCLPTLYAQFVSAHGIRNVDVRFQRIKALFCSLPNANKMVLLHLLRHLHKVAQHSKKNKMTISSLATTFASVLFKCPKELDSPLRTMTDQPSLAAVLATLISYHHLLLLSPEATPSLMVTASSEHDAAKQRKGPMAGVNHTEDGKPMVGLTNGDIHPHHAQQQPTQQFQTYQQPHDQSTQQMVLPEHSSTSHDVFVAQKQPNHVNHNVYWGSHGTAAPTLSPTSGGSRALTGPLSPQSTTSDPGISTVLESLISETCLGDIIVSPALEATGGGQAGWVEYQHLQAEQESRVDAVFGASSFERLSRLLAGGHFSNAGLVSREGPQYDPGTQASDASSSDSSESDDYSSHVSAPQDVPGFHGQGVSTPQMGAQGAAAQANIKRKRSLGQCARVNEKLLTRELNTEIPIDLSNPYPCLIQRLARRRSKSQRPANIAEMTLEQMKDEKRSIKMELKNFDGLFTTTYNRAPQKKDKEPLREMYALYKSIKRAIDDQNHIAAGKPMQVTRARQAHEIEPKSGATALRPSVEPSHQQPMVHTTAAPTSAIYSAEPGLFSGSVVGGSRSAMASTTTTTAATSTGSAVQAPGAASGNAVRPSKVWTPTEIRLLKQEKRDLKKKLCHFQNQFRTEFNRDVVSKKDREPMNAEYERYRELKTLLREIEGPSAT